MIIVVFVDVASHYGGYDTMAK